MYKIAGIKLLCVVLGLVVWTDKPLIAADTEKVRYEAYQLPRTKEDSATAEWNLQNLLYPEGAVVLEDLGDGKKGLRIGDSSGKQVGRYTIALREMWDTDVEPGTIHEVSVRMSANYRHGNRTYGFAGFGIVLPGYAVAVDISQFMSEDEEARLRACRGLDSMGGKMDMTDTVREIMGEWYAKDLHTYTLKWKTPIEGKEPSFELYVDGKKIGSITPVADPSAKKTAFFLSWEAGDFGGTGLIEFIEWQQTLVK